MRGGAKKKRTRLGTGISKNKLGIKSAKEREREWRQCSIRPNKKKRKQPTRGGDFFFLCEKGFLNNVQKGFVNIQTIQRTLKELW